MLLALGALLLSTATAHGGIVPLGPAVQVNTTFVLGENTDQQPPHLVPLPDGGFVVVWGGLGEIGRQPAVGRHIDPAGTPVGPEFPLGGALGDPPVTGR